MRIIPTRVGTRIGENCVVIGNKDHPHACGDKSIKVLRFWKTRGSSPRVWGQVDTGNVNKGSQRIIPTRVGTSNVDKKSLAGETDHPHACGDKSMSKPQHKS